MRVAVAVHIIEDFEVPAGVDFLSGEVNGHLTVAMLDPSSQAAFCSGRELRGMDGELLVVALGPPQQEDTLKDLFAMGADRILRVWDHHLESSDDMGRATVLAKLLEQEKVDLVLLGAQSMDEASGLLGPMTAELLGYNTVAGVSALERQEGNQWLVVQRKMRKGARELLKVALPAVITVHSDLIQELEPSLADSLKAMERKVEYLNLPSIGLAPEQAAVWNNLVRTVSVTSPRPGPRDIFIPDSSLPPLDRIQQIVSGGLAEKKGMVLEGSPEELAERLFQFLLERKYLA